jgi:ribosome-binding factor A
MSDVKRAVRVAERLREELAARVRDLGDPRVSGVIVSRVELTDDLQSAKVYVRRESGPPDERERKALLTGLESAGGKLRRDATRALALRRAPTLRFFWDEGPDAQSRVEELLREIERERS